jgi:hypothetical protein
MIPGVRLSFHEFSFVSLRFNACLVVESADRLFPQRGQESDLSYSNRAFQKTDSKNAANILRRVWDHPLAPEAVIALLGYGWRRKRQQAA